MFNQKVFTLLGMWLNGRVLPSKPRVLGSITGTKKRKGEEEEEEKEKKVYKHFARL
jgi:hypothetical protein